MPARIDPNTVAAEVIDVVHRIWQGDLISVVAHGSWVEGDFEASRSDVDLIAIVRDDPDVATIDALGMRLEGVFARHPHWTDRIELGVVSPMAIADLVHGHDSQRLVGRISPGEPLNLVPAERRRLLDWESASRGRTIHGTPGAIPAVPLDLVRSVLLEELKMWPAWIEESSGDEPVAYALLTVCRSVAYAATGEPHSKRAGGRWVSDRTPEFKRLLGSAEHVWYEPGSPQTLNRSEVARFINEWLPRAVLRLADPNR